VIEVVNPPLELVVGVPTDAPAKRIVPTVLVGKPLPVTVILSPLEPSIGVKYIDAKLKPEGGLM
jgi:hypothetical protein